MDHQESRIFQIRFFCIKKERRKGEKKEEGGTCKKGYRGAQVDYMMLDLSTCSVYLDCVVTSSGIC